MPKRSWPRAIPLTILLGLALATPVTVAAGPAEAVLSEINSARAKAGCGPLRLDQKLVAAAEGHASNMAEKDFFGHEGKPRTSRLGKRAQGKWRWTGCPAPVTAATS
jgi:uncharacterized protein YkwD